MPGSLRRSSGTINRKEPTMPEYTVAGVTAWAVDLSHKAARARRRAERAEAELAEWLAYQVDDIDLDAYAAATEDDQ